MSVAHIQHLETSVAARDNAMRACIANCEACHDVCMETIEHCLARGGNYAKPDNIRVLQDCAEMCATNANFMVRGSGMHGTVCGACAEACERCAEMCETWPDDAQMRACAEACRESAASCREMAGHHASMA